jgi:hypothetical protein
VFVRAAYWLQTLLTEESFDWEIIGDNLTGSWFENIALKFPLTSAILSQRPW